MGALRNPEPPSTPLEPLDRPHIAATPSAQLAPLGRSFYFGVFGAALGAILMVVGAATASAPIVWTAVVVVALAALILRSSTKAARHPLIVRD